MPLLCARPAEPQGPNFRGSVPADSASARPAAQPAGIVRGSSHSCVGGPKERNVAEYAALFAAAGITAPPTLVQMRDILSVVEVAL